MGFVTGRVYSQEKAASLVSVYIPTVPNPTSGNMAFVFEDDVIETNLNPEDAMKLVFSGGIVLPETINLARLPADYEDDRMTHLAGQFRTASTPKVGQRQTGSPFQIEGPDRPMRHPLYELIVVEAVTRPPIRLARLIRRPRYCVSGKVCLLPPYFSHQQRAKLSGSGRCPPRTLAQAVHGAAPGPCAIRIDSPEE